MINNIWGIWFICCLPIWILLGLAIAEYRYTLRKEKKAHDRRARKAYQR